jgi:hypothetical protein
VGVAQPLVLFRVSGSVRHTYGRAKQRGAQGFEPRLLVLREVAQCGMGAEPGGGAMRPARWFHSRDNKNALVARTNRR